MNANAEIERLVVDVSSAPLDPEKNFKAALEYEKLGQTASAVGFYLRAAEYGVNTHPMIVYTSLLKISRCIDDQKDRQISVKHVILQAISYLPGRPEAHFLLSQYHEKFGNWQECHSFARVGLLHANAAGMDPLPADVGYLGAYCLVFESAVSLWWLGRRDESKVLFDILDAEDIAPDYRTAVKSNLDRLNAELAAI